MGDEKVILPKPKRLSEFPGTHTQRFHGNMLAAQPDIALGVSVTIAHIAAVDAVYDQVVIMLLGAEGLSVSTMLRSIKSSHEKQKLTNRLIETKLHKEHLDLFRLINKELIPIRGIRNKFAHGLWGASHSVPDCLLLGEAQPWNDIAGAALELMQAELPLMKAKNFLVDLLGSETHNPRLHASEKAALIGVLSEMEANTRQQKSWSVFFPPEGQAQRNDPEVWSKDDIALAITAAAAAYTTVSAFASCVGPAAREVGPLLSKVQSQGLLRQDLRTGHSHSET